MAAVETLEKTLQKILIAEDNSKTRLFLKAQLELMGYTVVGVAADGASAVEMAEKLNPGLVLLDLKMPGMDGIEAAKAITSRGPIPIILLTGYTAEELTVRAIEAGVFAYLVKPVTKKQLEPAIRLALARYEEFKSLKKEVEDLREAIDTRKLVERAKGILMKRSNLSEEDAFRMLQSHSQKENKKMREIAESIISASKLI
ncbi:MAG: response regulator [Deltaproteobacteria bacterium]|nr:response regulator [Deltaproteobacteria bacterium]